MTNTNTTSNTIQFHTFDIAWDCEIQTFLQFLLDHDLKLESFNPSGPGGGNPEITVSGPQHQIEEIKDIF